MFKVFNRKKKQVDLLENPISPVIVNELGGIGELTFSVPSTYKHLELEGYIQVENDHEYVIKEIVTHGTNRDVVCMLNIEEILGMAWSKFISRDNTLMKCAELVLSGTKWRAIDKSSCKVNRNLFGTVTNSYNLLQMMCTVYNVEFIFDTYNKTVTFVDKVGKDAGVYFINDINLKQLNVDTHTHKYITRVIPVGKDGLTIETVNDGKNYLENKTYTTKNIYGIWQSDKHDNPKALMEDARRFLNEMAIPYETYEIVVDDLYALKGYAEFQYGLGDVVTIIDGDTETRIQQRVIQRTYNLLEPDKDTIHIANKDATFEDYYKRLQTIADMTQSVIGSDGSINGGSISDGTISGDKIENDSINSGHISSGSITSNHIKAEQILADHIMSNQITTNHLVADSITSDLIQANSIDTKHLKANTITSDHIQSNTINSNHISANTITSGHIQSGAITAGSGIIADGAIGNAQISKIDAGKIDAGSIDTSKVTIQGTNGHLRLKGNRLQVFDGVGNRAKERVSVGDVNGDGTIYGLRVRGADGQTVLLDENGVKSEGITDGAITNDKINEDANIDGAKLNINSVINKINTDGTEVIQGTKVEVDGTNLGVKLSEITNKQTSDGEKITQAQAQITANQNAIKLKVDEQVYTADKKDMTSKLEKNTSEISTMKGQIALKVEQSDIENAKSEIEGTINSKIDTAKAEIKVTTDKISQKVSSVESTTTTLTSKVNNAQSTANSANSKIDGLQLGTRNYILNSALKDNATKFNVAAGVTRDTTKLTPNGNNSFYWNISGLTSNSWRNASQKRSGSVLQVGKTYTASCNVYVPSNHGIDAGNALEIICWNAEGNRTGTFSVNANQNTTDKWQRLERTFTVPANTVGFTMQVFVVRNGKLYAGDYSMVEGSKGSWSPAPEDLDSSINAVDKKVGTLQGEYNTTKSKVASLETNLNGITSRVKNVETKTVTVDGKVANQETRLAQAEQKITDKAITSVVEEAQFIKDMNGKISTNKSNISKVEQKANSITSRVEGLDGKYTQLKQTVDGIDVTGKVSFSDLSTAGKTTINGANIDTTNLRVRGELISGQINGVGGIRFADGAVIASYDSHVAGYKGISISAPDVKLGDKVAIYHPTMYYDVIGKNNTSSGTTTWTMSSSGALTCASANLSGTLNVRNGVIYGMNNLALARGSIYIPTFGTSYTYDFIRGGNSSIAFADNGPIHFIYNGTKSSFIAGGSIYLPHAGNVNCDHFRLGAGIMASPSSGSFHFLTANGSTSPLYAGVLYSASRMSLDEPMVVSNNSVFDTVNSVDVIDTQDGLRLYNPIPTTKAIDKSTEVVKTEYDEDKNEITTSIDYTTAISTLWKAVQELKSEVDSLKQENDELKLLLNKGE